MHLDQTHRIVGFSHVGFDGTLKESLFFQREKPSRDNTGARVVALLDAPVCVVLGRNGSGKTTLSRSLANSDGTAALLLADPTSREALVAPQPENLHVFNEDFIRENVAIKTGSLGAIALMGEQVAQHEELLETQRRLAKQAKAISDAKKAIDAHATTARTQYEDIRESIKSSQWRDAYRRIDGTARNVGESVVQRLIALSRQLSSGGEGDGDQQRLDDLLREIERATEASTDPWVPALPQNPFDMPAVRECIASQSPPPALPAADREVASRLSARITGARALSDLIRLMSGTSGCCPTCLQDLPDDYRVTVRSLAETALRELENSSGRNAALDLQVPLPERHELPRMVDVSETLRREYEEAFDEWRGTIERVNLLLRDRADDPVAKLDLDEGSIDTALRGWSTALSSVADVVKDHNLTVSNAEENRATARELCDRLVAAVLIPQVRQYDTTSTNVAEAETSLEALKSARDALEDTEARIKGELANEAIAADAINGLLRLVFGQRRLALTRPTHEGPGYSITSYGAPVPASRLSTGERNALALTYFLVSLARDQQLSDGWASPKLVVLDDPISSFDMENKYGVLTLLNEFARTCYSDKSGTRLLILTHDLTVAYDLSKTLQATLATCKSSGVVAEKLLDHGIARDTDFDTNDVYRDILRRAYLHVLSQEQGESVDGEMRVAPSELRLVFEAFARFELNEAITIRTDNPQLQKAFPETVPGAREFLQTFVPSFMNRIAHSSLSVQALDFGLRSQLSDEDLVRYIRDTLIFIHTVSPAHLPLRIEQKYKTQAVVDENISRWRDCAFASAGR